MERVLLEKIREGDNKAFAELYEKYAEYALRVAMAVTRDKMSAADVVQETFIKVYKGINGFDLDREFKPWFYRILINECNRLLGKTPDTVLVEDFQEAGMQEYIKEDDDYNFEEYEDLYKAIESLEDINRVTIILKYLNGFKEVEIAEILGININTVKSRLFKGRKKLKNLMGDFEGGIKSNG